MTPDKSSTRGSLESMEEWMTSPDHQAWMGSAAHEQMHGQMAAQMAGMAGMMRGPAG